MSKQKRILADYAKKHGYKNTMFFVDDGISGTTFDRPDFQRMERMIETGEIGTVIVKDLSRFGREHMLTNYENEQRNLMQKVEDAERLINTAQQENIDVRNFLANIRQCTDIKELTPSTVNKLIDKIEVFDRVRGADGKKHVSIKIHFVGVGVIQFPDAEMLEKTKEEMKAFSKKAS